MGGNPLSYTDPSGQFAIVDDAAVLGVLGVGGILMSPLGQKALQDAGNAIKKICNSSNPCPPCKTVSGRIVPVDSVGYRPLDVIPDDRIQHGVAGSHHNIFVAKQNPNNCQCFWAKQKYVLKPGQLPVGAVQVEPFVN